MKLSQRWKQTSLPNKLLVTASGLMAFGTLFYAGAAVLQIHILNRSAQQQAEQTNRLIAASERTANTAQTQANTSASQANSIAEQSKTMKESLGLTNRAVTAGEKQANTSQVSARAAEQSANIAREAMVATTRPYVAAFSVPFEGIEVNKIVSNTVKFANDGNSPAEVSAEAQFVISDLPISPRQIAIANPQQFSMITYIQPTLVPQHRETGSITVTSGIPLRPADFDAIQNFRKSLLFYGIGWYRGIGGKVPINWCSLYWHNPSTGRSGWRDCIIMPSKAAVQK